MIKNTKNIIKDLESSTNRKRIHLLFLNYFKKKKPVYFLEPVLINFWFGVLFQKKTKQVWVCYAKVEEAILCFH